MPAPPLIRLGSSCCNHLLKCSFNNDYNLLLRCQLSVIRSLAYSTTCGDQQVSSKGSSSSSDTNVLFHHPIEKLGGKINNVIYEAMEQLKRERRSALLFMRQLKESGFKHDLETYMSVVRLLSHWDWGMDPRSNKLLNDVIDNTNWKVGSFEISDQLFDALIDEKLIKDVEGLVEVYASAGRFQEAIHTVAEMKNRSGFMVSTQTCNFVLHMLFKLDKEDMVEVVYRQLKSNGLIPNMHTYVILMRQLCRKGCLNEAWKVIEEMEEAGVEPTAYIYTTYISGLCKKGKTDLAFQVLKNFRESNKPIDVFAYGCVILGFVRDSKLQDAEHVFRDMKLKQVVPDSFCYQSLIIGYCGKGDIDKALDLLKEMESRGIQTDHVFVRRMVQYLSNLGMLSETLCLFKHFTQQSSVVFIDRLSFQIAIDAACKLGKMDDAMGFVEEMKSRKIKPVVIQDQALKPTGFQGQWVQPNVGQDEGVKSVPNEGVQSEGVGSHDGVVQDDRDQVADGQLHTTQQTPALHKLTSLSAHHALILMKFQKSKRGRKYKRGR